MTEDAKTISKTLSYWLRHRPDAAGLVLDGEGWASVDAVLAELSRSEVVSFEKLAQVVESNDKQRFEFNSDLQKIRARQGHSIEIELNLQALKPPRLLYHGTVAKFVEAIRAGGLSRMARHHVHLSPDVETANRVGTRRGKPVILTVSAKRMAEAGHQFMCSANGVWLTEHVPVEFILFPDF